MKRYPNRRCPGCGRQTQATSGYHRACAAEVHQIPLPEGRWVPNGRGIVVRVNADGRPYRAGDAA